MPTHRGVRTHTQRALELTLTRSHEIIMVRFPAKPRQKIHTGHGIHPGNFLFIYSGVLCNIQHCKQILLGALFRSLIKVFHMNIHVVFDSWCQTLKPPMLATLPYVATTRSVTEGGGMNGWQL